MSILRLISMSDEESIDPDDIRKRILRELEIQGFKVNPHIKPPLESKELLKNIHRRKKMERIRHHRKRLKRCLRAVKEHTINGADLDPERIDLEIREILPNDGDADIAFWWDLVWWSLPHTKMYGRQIRLLLWDKGHDSPFGLLSLQSPPIRSNVRDNFLGIPEDEHDYWINQGMYAQRVGAFPPYNDLLGGKFVAMTMVSNELREIYERKYEGLRTLLKDRILPARLLFVTTTSAYGKSSMYDRIRYKEDEIGEAIGFTSGTGTFHIPEDVYQDLIKFMAAQGKDVSRGFGTGPSRKLRLTYEGLQLLGIGRLITHNVRRSIYVFFTVNNFSDIVKHEAEPEWKDYSFSNLFKYWHKRYCLPRAERIDRWRDFDSQEFIRNAEALLDVT